MAKIRIEAHRGSEEQAKGSAHARESESTIFVFIDGIRFVTNAATWAGALVIAMKTAKALGIDFEQPPER